MQKSIKALLLTLLIAGTVNAETKEAQVEQASLLGDVTSIVTEKVASTVASVKNSIFGKESVVAEAVELTRTQAAVAFEKNNKVKVAAVVAATVVAASAVYAYVTGALDSLLEEGEEETEEEVDAEEAELEAELV